MGRLIDADKLKQHYAWWENGTAEMTLAEAKKNFDVIIDLQPTCDPYKHGHWAKDMGGYWCSVCNKYFEYGDSKYCPHCGAKMDEVEDG